MTHTQHLGLQSSRAVGIALFTLFAIFPFAWATAVALSGNTSFMWRFPQGFLAHQITPEWFLRVVVAIPFMTYLRNSLILAGGTTLGVLLLAIPCGFALAQMQFAGRKVLFGVLLVTLMLPSETMLVPNFITCIKLGLVDSYAGAMLPNIASAFGVFLIKQAFEDLPGETLDAARVDGASEWQVLWRVAVPLTLPMIGALAVLTFVTSWNDYLWPAVVLNSQNKLPLAVGVYHDLTGPFATSTSMLMAAVVLSVLPVLAGFAFTQRFFLAATPLTPRQAI